MLRQILRTDESDKETCNNYNILQKTNAQGKIKVKDEK